MTINTEVQKLEPDALVELFKLDGTAIGGSVLYFHANTTLGPIWWQGTQYDAWPMQAEGFSRTSEKQSTPRLTVANIDGSISQLCLQFNDMLGSTLTRIRTFAQFLDAENFKGPERVIAPYTQTTVEGTASIILGDIKDATPYHVQFVVSGYTGMGFGVRLSDGTAVGPLTGDGLKDITVTSGTGDNTLEFYEWDGEATLTVEELSVREIIGNPDADPTQQFSPEIWFVERKSVENNEAVEFELASAFDLNGVKLPRRQIIANYCAFKSVGGYRGPYCQYTGPAVAMADGTPTTNIALDDCGGKISDCKLREWPDDVLNFGGFPAAGLVRT